MELEVRKLKERGKLNGSFSLSEELNNSLLSDLSGEFSSKVTVVGDYDILEGDEVWIDATVTAPIIAPCSRCLKQASFTLTAELSEKFTTDPSDEDSYTYAKGVIDLNKAVEDCIVTSLPLTVYCKSDCKGLCQNCGADLNETDCDCRK